MKNMSLSSRTRAILNNMSRINQGIMFLPSHTQRTHTNLKDVVVRAEITEEFGARFGLADLSKFLSIMGLHDDPKLSLIEGKYLLLQGNDGRKFKFTLAHDEQINIPPDQDLKMPDTIVEFDLPYAEIQSVCKHVSIADLPNISFRSDGKHVHLLGHKQKDNTSDAYTIKLVECDKAFFMHFFTYKVAALMENPYHVIIGRGMAKFVSSDITYWLAPEDTSSYS